MASKWDDIIYLSLLVISIGLGPQIRKLQNPVIRQRVSALIGFLIVLLVSGGAILHPLLTVVVNGIITLYLNKRNCHIFSFVFCFAYLAFFRICHHFGLPCPPAHTNAVQMILTLKMVGLTFEVREAFYRKIDTKEKNNMELPRILNVKPSFEDIFCYSFCHAGVLTGPYYSYRTYWDSFYAPYSQHANTKECFIRRICVVPMYLVLFLFLGSIFPLEYAESEEIFERSVWYRVWYMSPLFFVFRMRIYIGFVLSECQCITFGIGAYPSKSNPKPGQGPTELAVLKTLDSHLESVEYNYETIHNVDEYETEFGATSKEALRGWNMTVQYWLAIYVYKRVPWKNLRVTITMLTSAFWHGVYPGYYLALLTVPFVLIAENSMIKALKKETTTPFDKRIGHVVGNFLKLQAFSYMGIGFFLLTAEATLQYCTSIYFIGHILIAVFYATGITIMSMKNKPFLKQSRNKGETTKKGN